MPQGRGSSKKSKSEPKEEPKVPESDAPPEPSVNGILIQVGEGENGPVRNIQTLGETTANEVPTLLRLAAKDVERQLGIE